MNEAAAHVGHKDYQSSKLGMWLFVFSEIVLFGGLFIGYSYSRAKYPLEFHEASGHLSVPIGVGNTIVLLTSGLLMALGITAIQRGEKRRCLRMVAGTILLGLLFLTDKAIEWGLEFHHGIWPGSPKVSLMAGGEQVFFGLYFTMTGLHGLHVLAGIGVLAYMLLSVSHDKITREDFVKLENSGLYWHLVDVVWIFLLPLFYLAA